MAGLSPPPYLNSDSLVRAIVEATSRALHSADRDGHVAAERSGDRGVDRGIARPPGADIPLDRAHEVDAETVAQWVVQQYQGRSYRGVVIGSRHGGAAHLAAALQMPWLPTGFEADVRWPGGSAFDVMAAMAYGMAAGLSVLSVNHGVLVRQVHDPVSVGAGAGGRVSLQVRWRALPDAYRDFLATHLERAASVIVFRDVQPWPVLDLGGEYSFQLGSAISGLDFESYVGGAALVRAGGHWSTEGAFRERSGEQGVEPGVDASARQWAHATGRSFYSVLYNGAETLSAAVADVYREWLRDTGKTGNRLIVETGRLLDPRHAIRSGSVPYWCATGTRACVASAELWVAASNPFTSIDVFPEKPDHATLRAAPRDQWEALARFATRRGVVNPMGRAYPARRRAQAPRDRPRDLPRDPPPPAPRDFPEPVVLTVDVAIARLRDNAFPGGLLVSFPARD